MSDIVTQQGQLMVRFRYGQPPASSPSLMHELGGGRSPRFHEAEEVPWQPEDVERAFATIRAIFRLAEQMSKADADSKGRSYGYFTIREPGTTPRERKPLEVVGVSMGSLETVLALGGALATGTVLRYVFALIEEAFTIRPRIRKQRAALEADRLEEELRAMTTKQEMVRLAALQLDRAAPRPVAVDFWLGQGDEPPHSEAEEP